MARRPSARMLEKLQVETHQLASVVVLPDHTDGMMYQKACAHLRELAMHQTRILAWFDEPVRAAHVAWKLLTTRRASVVGPLDAAIADQKKEIARYQELREAEAAAHAARLAAIATPGDPQEDVASDFFGPAVVDLEAGLRTPQADRQPGIVSVDVWKWRVVDLSRVPAKYLTIDSDKINRLVNAMKGEAEIPGVEIYQERQIRAMVPR